jgi:1-acyl-sn-glycerol-3-phosphate acyltransferase
MIYRLLKFLASMILKVLRRWSVEGNEKLPANGGIVLVANHISYWDPVAIICAFNRKVHFMAKAELFNIPVLNYVLKIAGSFPVRRDTSDRSAIRTAAKLLEEGEVVGIFPEGTRSHTGELLKPNLGASMIAARAGVPMIPVAVIGTRGVFGRVKVRVGNPVDICKPGKCSKSDLEKASDLIMEQINFLIGQK